MKNTKLLLTIFIIGLLLIVLFLSLGYFKDNKKIEKNTLEYISYQYKKGSSYSEIMKENPSLVFSPNANNPKIKEIVSNQNPNPQIHKIEISENGINPSERRIKPGDSVKFMNKTQNAILLDQNEWGNKVKINSYACLMQTFDFKGEYTYIVGENQDIIKGTIVSE